MTSGKKAVELENHLRVTRQTVSRWRNGHNLPDDLQIREIAHFFGVRCEWLVGKDEHKTLRGVPLKEILSLSEKKFEYFESLGYRITPSEPVYEEDENGNHVIVGTSCKIVYDGKSVFVSDEELDQFLKEVESFVDYKMTQLFKK